MGRADQGFILVGHTCFKSQWFSCCENFYQNLLLLLSKNLLFHTNQMYLEYEEWPYWQWWTLLEQYQPCYNQTILDWTYTWANCSTDEPANERAKSQKPRHRKLASYVIMAWFFQYAFFENTHCWVLIYFVTDVPKWKAIFWSYQLLSIKYWSYRSL